MGEVYIFTNDDKENKNTQPISDLVKRYMMSQIHIMLCILFHMRYIVSHYVNEDDKPELLNIIKNIEDLVYSIELIVFPPQ